MPISKTNSHGNHQAVDDSNHHEDDKEEEEENNHDAHSDQQKNQTHNNKNKRNNNSITHKGRIAKNHNTNNGFANKTILDGNIPNNRQ